MCGCTSSSQMNSTLRPTQPPAMTLSPTGTLHDAVSPPAPSRPPSSEPQRCVIGSFTFRRPTHEVEVETEWGLMVGTVRRVLVFRDQSVQFQVQTRSGMTVATPQIVRVINLL